MAKKELTTTEFRAIIREEAMKIKKRITLEDEKKNLQEELNNLGSSNKKIMAQMFVEFLPEDFPNQMHMLSNTKNIGLDSAYNLLIGAYETKFENENNASFDWDSFEFMDELESEMDNRFGSEIEF